MLPYGIVFISYTAVARSLKYMTMIFHYETIWTIVGYSVKNVKTQIKYQQLYGKWKIFISYNILPVQYTSFPKILRFMVDYHMNTICDSLKFYSGRQDSKRRIEYDN